MPTATSRTSPLACEHAQLRESLNSVRSKNCISRSPGTGLLVPVSVPPLDAVLCVDHVDSHIVMDGYSEIPGAAWSARGTRSASDDWPCATECLGVMVMRAPRLGTLVMLRTGPRFGSVAGGRGKGVAGEDFAQYGGASMSENPAPTQRRAPPPNGSEVLGSTSLLRNQSGR